MSGIRKVEYPAVISETTWISHVCPYTSLLEFNANEIAISNALRIRINYLMCSRSVSRQMTLRKSIIMFHQLPVFSQLQDFS